jgi:hypothetical protein
MHNTQLYIKEHPGCATRNPFLHHNISIVNRWYVDSPTMPGAWLPGPHETSLTILPLTWLMAESLSAPSLHSHTQPHTCTLAHQYSPDCWQCTVNVFTPKVIALTYNAWRVAARAPCDLTDDLAADLVDG